MGRTASEEQGAGSNALAPRHVEHRPRGRAGLGAGPTGTQAGPPATAADSSKSVREHLGGALSPLDLRAQCGHAISGENEQTSPSKSQDGRPQGEAGPLEARQGAVGGQVQRVVPSLRAGSTVFADTGGELFGAKVSLDSVRCCGRYESANRPAHLEDSALPDAVEISLHRGQSSVRCCLTPSRGARNICQPRSAPHRSRPQTPLCPGAGGRRAALTLSRAEAARITPDLSPMCAPWPVGNNVSSMNAFGRPHPMV